MRTPTPSAAEQAAAFRARLAELRRRIHADTAELTVTEATLARLEGKPRTAEDVRALYAARRVMRARADR